MSLIDWLLRGLRRPRVWLATGESALRDRIDIDIKLKLADRYSELFRETGNTTAVEMADAMLNQAEDLIVEQLNEQYGQYRD